MFSCGEHWAIWEKVQPPEFSRITTETTVDGILPRHSAMVVDLQGLGEFSTSAARQETCLCSASPKPELVVQCQIHLSRQRVTEPVFGLCGESGSQGLDPVVPFLLPCASTLCSSSVVPRLLPAGFPECIPGIPSVSLGC